MKRIYPFIALLFISNFSFAQYKNFDLSKYKLPEIKRHQLDLSFYLNNYYRDANIDDDDSDSNQNKFEEELTLNYSFFQNTRKLQRNYSGSFFSDIELANYNQDDDYYLKNKKLNTNCYFNLDNRFYLNEDKFFLHIEPVLAFSHNWNKKKNRRGTKEHETNRNTSFDPNINIGAGFGRIEPVGDLRQAICILEELHKNDVLKRVLSDEEVYVAATKISQLKNERFFDSRLRKIYEIKSLDSLFQSMDVLSGDAATYFTSLNDMWLYGNEDRFSGNRIQFDFLTGWNYSRNEVDTELYYETGEPDEKSSETNKTKYADLGAELAFESHKPIGLKWQREFSTSALYRYMAKPDYSDDTKEGTAVNRFHFNIRYVYKWFMNTRTNISFGCSGNYHLVDDIDVDYRSDEYHANLFASINYYFSPRLRFQYNFNTYYSMYDYDGEYYSKVNNVGISNQIRLNYAIF